jgi:hypothetical protein
MKIFFTLLIAMSLYAAQQPSKPSQASLSADETLLNEIESVLVKLNSNNEAINKNIEEIKRLKRVSKNIQRENEDILDEVAIKCKALYILNADIANGICAKVKKEKKVIEESKNFAIEIDSIETFKKYPNIAKKLFSNDGLVEFQIRKINSQWVAKRRGYSIPISRLNRHEAGMFVMIKLENNKFITTSYKYTNMKKYKSVD